MTISKGSLWKNTQSGEVVEVTSASRGYVYTKTENKTQSHLRFAFERDFSPLRGAALGSYKLEHVDEIVKRIDNDIAAKANDIDNVTREEEKQALQWVLEQIECYTQADLRKFRIAEAAIKSAFKL